MGTGPLATFKDGPTFTFILGPWTCPCFCAPGGLAQGLQRRLYGGAVSLPPASPSGFTAHRAWRPPGCVTSGKLLPLSVRGSLPQRQECLLPRSPRGFNDVFKVLGAVPGTTKPTKPGDQDRDAHTAFSSLCTGAGFDKRFLRESQKPVESPKEFEFLESLMDYGNDGSHCHHLPL